MDNLKLLLHEYLDEELPADLRSRVEVAIKKSSALGTIFEEEQKVRNSFKQDRKRMVEELDYRMNLARERIIQDVQSPARPRARLSFWNKSLLVPMPVLAALTIAMLGIVGLGIFLRSERVNTMPVIAVEQPQSLSPVFVSNKGNIIKDDHFTIDSKGMEVTIQVKDLNQLLAILEGSVGKNEIHVHLPISTGLQSIGEPMLIRASERE
jgi:hypothetical protein